MKEEIIEKILRKMKETVSENNYKLALAITGRRPGKIKDVLMSSKDGEALLEYIENLQSQLKAKEEVIKEAREYIKEHIRIDDEYPAYMEMLITERDELDEILSKGENK